MEKQRSQKLVLCILDGWGESSKKKYNAIKQANTEHYDKININYPKTFLRTSGEDVGLPEGQMGNSEVGHTNIGAGRIVYSDLPRINKYFLNGGLTRNKSLKRLLEGSIKKDGSIHMIGLISSGGVHSHQKQIIEIIDHISKFGIKVNVHAITDGRDVGPETGLRFIKDFEERLPKNAKIATLMGRYYAMDRDKRWNRTEAAYRAIIEGNGKRFNSATEAVKRSYEDGIFDEFICPALVGDYSGLNGKGNSLIALNFRADRFRQILTSILKPDFQYFKKNKSFGFERALGLVSYSKELDTLMDVMFPQAEIKNTLGSCLEKNNIKQLRLAETEKYAHVTYFFNGGREELSENEDRILIKSPLVETYDKQPKMSCVEVCDSLIEAILGEKHRFILVNFANPDMVGHTGSFEATKEACEALDICLGRVLKAIKQTNSVMLLTADHGNAELMYDEKLKMPHTRHTLNPVPFHLINSDSKLALQSSGRLCDIAPTVLELLNIEKPREMSGMSLLRQY